MIQNVASDCWTDDDAMYSVMTSRWWCDSQQMAGKHFDCCWQDVIGQQLKWLVSEMPQETVICLH